MRTWLTLTLVGQYAIFQSLKSHHLSLFYTLTWNPQNPKELCQLIRLFQDYNWIIISTNQFSKLCVEISIDIPNVEIPTIMKPLMQS